MTEPLNPRQFPEQVDSRDVKPGDKVHVTVGDPFGLSSTMMSGRVVRSDKTRLHIEHQGGEDDGGISSFRHEDIRSVFRHRD